MSDVPNHRIQIAHDVAGGNPKRDHPMLFEESIATCIALRAIATFVRFAVDFDTQPRRRDDLFFLSRQQFLFQNLADRKWHL